MESPAFPRLTRWLTLLIIALLALSAARASGALRQAAWSTGGLLLMVAAWALVAWLGYWIVHSRTRLDGDTLVQTWIWTKRARAADVAQLKLVHLPRLEWLVAPRLLVRLRSGGVLWFQAADAGVLHAFGARVLQARGGP